MINLDFADIKTVMENMGKAMGVLVKVLEKIEQKMLHNQLLITLF